MPKHYKKNLPAVKPAKKQPVKAKPMSKRAKRQRGK